MTTSEERKQITVLEGLPSPPPKPFMAFKNKPTPISIPTNKPHAARNSAFFSVAEGRNPYSRLGVRKKHFNEDVGNVTSSRTLIRGIDNYEPPPKRRKTLDHDSGYEQEGYANRNSGSSLLPYDPEIDSSNDDDIEETPYQPKSSRSKRQSLSNKSNSLNNAAGPSGQMTKYDAVQNGSDKNKPIIVPDGEDTTWAHNRFRLHDSDPIESSSDPIFLSSSHKIPHKQERDNTQPLKIDLATKQKKPSGVAKNMKGKKSVQSTRRPLSLEPLSGSHGSPTTPHAFPVKEAYVGVKLFQAQSGQNLKMFWNRNALRLEVNQVRVIDILLTPEFCTKFIHSYTNDDSPVIQLKATDGLMVTIRLDPAYDAKQYHKQRSSLLVQPEILLADGNDTLWKIAVRDANQRLTNTQDNVVQKQDCEDTLERQSDKVARLNSLRHGGGDTCLRDTKSNRSIPLPFNPTRRSPKSKSPGSVQGMASETPSNDRHDTRLQTRASNVRRSARNMPLKEQTDELILVYPPGPGGVNINTSDLSRLAPGEYLNDTLIEFGLKLWLRNLENNNPHLASQIHIFNSFFYKKLNQSKDVHQTFESMRKWTSKYDIFQKKYIIVPINENLHWYLAIIYWPEHILHHKAPSVSVARKQTRSTAQSSMNASGPTSSDERDDQTITSSEAEVERNLNNDFQSSCIIDSDEVEVPNPGLLTESKEESTNADFDIRTASGHQELKPSETLPSASATNMLVDGIEENGAPSNQIAVGTKQFYQPRPKGRKGKERAQFESDILMLDDSVDEVVDDDALQKTYIFIMDSLGTRHVQAVRKLALYLQLEAKDKKGIADAGKATGKFAAVPVQPNFCDCGVYLLHFAQTFMSDPITYSKRILSQKKSIANHERQKTWNDSQVADMREALSATIRHLSEEWQMTKRNEKADDDDDDVTIVEQIIEPGTRGAKASKQTAKSTSSESRQVVSAVKSPARRIR